ncbi:MAG: alpha/beta hydrolase-fold protein [Acidimicrobiales bacterium]
MIRRNLVVGGLVAALVALFGVHATPGALMAYSTNPFPGCTAPPSASQSLALVVGSVACQELTDSQDDLGAGIAVPFEYYVPPACSATNLCPVLYLLHGFGGSYQEMLGSPSSSPSSLAWVAAETSAPPAGFESDPWNYADPSTWNPASALDMILVAPLGQTLPGGYGPQPGMDSYWVDWNPRYAKGGDSPRYQTPAPRFATFLTQELPSFVTTYLPAGTGRQYSAIAGVSLGGYGSYDLGLQHPDLYSAMMAVSGAMNFLFAPAPQPGYVTLPVGVQPPVPVSYEQLPGVTGLATQLPLPSQVGSFTTALDALGDPVADQAYFRGNMPTDLAMNGRAYDSNGDQLLGIDDFWNDMVPQQGAQELAAGGRTSGLQNDLGSEPFENIVFPMNVDMESDFALQDVHNVFAIHQGNHTDTYRNAWFRGLEQYAYARLAHPGSAAVPVTVPASFDYRTISDNFSIWGWQFALKRAPVEFLTLRSVSCHALTLQGSGTVTVTVPSACGTGHDGNRTFGVDLGNTQAMSEPFDASVAPAYGNTVTVELSPLT